MDKNIFFADIEQQVIKSLTDLNEDAKNFASKCKPDMSESDKEKMFAERHTKFILPFVGPFDGQDFAKILYRSRLADSFKPGQTITDPQAFSFIPEVSLSESFPPRGRMNLTGQSIFYGSNLLKTSLSEIKFNQKVFMACFSKIMRHSLDCYIVDPSFYLSQSGYAPLSYESINVMGQLFLSEDSDKVSKYLASSFFAHYILYGQKEKSYNAIIYPSVKAKKDLRLESNIAIKPEYFEANYMLDWVIMGHVDSSLTTVSFQYLGLPDDNELHWYEVRLFPDDFITFDYFGKNGKKVSKRVPYTDSLFTEKLYEYLLEKIRFYQKGICKQNEFKRTLLLKHNENVYQELSVNGTSFYVEFIKISCQCTIQLVEVDNPDKVILGH